MQNHETDAGGGNEAGRQGYGGAEPPQGPPPRPETPPPVPPAPPGATWGGPTPPPPGAGEAPAEGRPQPGAGWALPGAAPAPAPPGTARRRGVTPLVAAVAAAALLAGGVGGGIAGWAIDRDGSSSSSSATAGGGSGANKADQAAAGSRAPDSVAGIAARTIPGTVTIKVQQQGGESTGAGFVLDKDGNILTNNHVVSGAAAGGKVQVIFSDGTTVTGTVVGTAPGYDLAVVKVEGVKNLQPLALGDSDSVAVGDAAVAIGAPFGLDNTVTSGIISAKNRPVASGGDGQQSYMNALQTDAPLNPGNSGGPLLDAQGRVIGVNSAIQSTDNGGSGGAQSGGQPGSIGLGFAIPINQAKWVADQLIQDGHATYAQLGVLPDASYQGAGARVAGGGSDGQAPVSGPAAKAGLQSGDVVTKIDGQPVADYRSLLSEVWSHKPGDQVKLTYTRGGTEHTVDVTLGQRAGEPS
ncbi:S1C family serine protease [Yinghuangia seranimata]|uniref:S1C family serine protease n=1 Tax=Yinghuangia seranimata TaxID=408067 RepID=UPI00248B1E43|nr:trypsin-like peptidase domain-containing protein [Yinghuangia seranimata]MDI2131664.1 trypsin-like peptidase domain-containing protein [Yinghuangia seranimata]